MHIGALTNPLRDPLADIRWTGEQGFDYVEIALGGPLALPERLDVAVLRAALAERGLPAIVRAAPDLPVAHAAARIRRSALDECRHSIDVAAGLGARLLVTRFMHWPEWMPDESGVELYGQLYDRLCAHGQEAGVTVAIENHPLNTHQLKRLRHIVQRAPALYVAVNVGHANIQTPRNQAREFLFDMGERLIHAYLSDNDGADNQRLPLATPQAGGVDWRRELGQFRRFGYDRTFTLDVGGDRRWLLASRDYLRELWQSLAS